MTQLKDMATCKEAGLRHERASISLAIRNRQRKHKAVAELQARLKEVTHEILRMEVKHAIRQ